MCAIGGTLQAAILLHMGTYKGAMAAPAPWRP